MGLSVTIASWTPAGHRRKNTSKACRLMYVDQHAWHKPFVPCHVLLSLSMLALHKQNSARKAPI